MMNTKKIACLVVISLLLGGLSGWFVTSKRAKNNLVFFLGGMARTEIHIQEQAASKAYLKESPDVALWALNQLLWTYAHYKEIPTAHPDEWRSQLRLSSALVYARLADTYAKLELEDKRQQAIDYALAIGLHENEEQLMQQMRLLNKLERRQMDKVEPSSETLEIPET